MRFCPYVTGLLLVSVAFAQQASNPEPFVFEKDVAVNMRDGVVLRADVLRPKGEGRFPVLVYRTPYNKEEALKDYTTFRRGVERGYAVVVQDVRGRYASDGEFRPYENEGRDGFDTIEWAAAQPWSNGSVGTFGLSYPGAVQWLAAIEDPPHLKAMVPAMTFSTPQNFFYAGGTWDMSWMEWIWVNIAPDTRVKKGLPGPKTYEEAIAAWPVTRAQMQNALPLGEVRELQEVAPYYAAWTRHPADDPWWDWCELRNKYSRTKAAVLNLSGWYDDNYGPEGATTNFMGLRRARAGEADPRTALLIGPWVHGVASTRTPKAGDREFVASGIIDYDETILRWMDHYLKGLNNGVERDPAVHYFVMGGDHWADSSTWPPVSTPRNFYLSGSGAPGKRGSLARKPAQVKSAFSSFVSDPASPVINPYDSSGAHDYQKLSERNDVLTFDSEVLPDDLEVTGNIEARIFLSCDCRDTDLWVRLLDVAPDGTAFNLMSPGLDVLRASYRDISRGRQLLQPGRIYELRLKNLITSNVFQRGHRIRVQISASFFPNFSRNLHTGKLESESSEMRKATIRIYHDAAYASRLVVPVTQR
jgi:putative CocE/NonD family hydrolase